MKTKLRTSLLMACAALESIQPRRIKANWLGFVAAMVVIGLVVMSASWLTIPPIVNATGQSTATAQPTVAAPQTAFNGYSGVIVIYPMDQVTGTIQYSFPTERHVWFANDHAVRVESYQVADHSPLPAESNEEKTFRAMSFSHPTGQLPGIYIPVSIEVRENQIIEDYSSLTEEINTLPYGVLSIISPISPLFLDPAHHYGPIGKTLEEGEQALKNDFGNVQLVRNRTILGRNVYVFTLKDWLRNTGQTAKTDHIITWVDQQTLIYLGAQEFDANDQLVSEWEFRSLDFNPQLDPKLFTLDAPRNVVRNIAVDSTPVSLDHMDEQWSQVAKTASFAIFKPTGIPNQQTIDGVIYSTGGKTIQYDANRHILTTEYQIGRSPNLDIFEASPDMINWADPSYETVQIGSITGHYRNGYRQVLVFERDGTQIVLITNGIGFSPLQTSAWLTRDDLIKIAESFIAVSQRL